MVKTFTTADWNQNFPPNQGRPVKGLSIPHAEYLIDDPIVQVFINTVADKYSLMGSLEGLFIGVSADEIILMTPQSFNGKIVIK